MPSDILEIAQKMLKGEKIKGETLVVEEVAI